MQPSFDTRLEILRASGLRDPIDHRRMRRAIQRGEWMRLAPGSYARVADWRAMLPHERHRVRVLEVARRLRPPAVLSHRAAAALWGMDLLGTWPSAVEVTVERASGGRSSGVVRRRALGLGGLATVPLWRHRVTTPAQTALDLARALPFMQGLCAVDQAVWMRRPGGALTTLGEIRSLLDHADPRRGDARARAVLAFASPLADNVRESQARVLLARMGFPAPRLQERRVLPSGRVVFGDFYFPEHDHWAELDGQGKYRGAPGDPRSPADIVIDEKNRENEIRRLVRGFSRWEPADLDHPRRLYDILTADGLPSRLPRP